MPKRYCPSCGTGADYEITKPTSCPKCKKSYDGIITPPVTVAANPIVTEPRVPHRQPVIIQEEETEADTDVFEPDADLGSMKIKLPSHHGAVTIGQVAGSGRSDEPVRNIPKRINKAAKMNELLPNRNVKSSTPVTRVTKKRR